MEKKKISLKDGFIKQNMVFMSGLLVAPAIACASTLMKSLAVCLVFSLVSFFTILVCRAVPRRIAYTLRIIVYTLAAAAFYIPAYMLSVAAFGSAVVASAGVYLPILVTNSLILSKTETRFYGEPMTDMVIDSAVFILGFDAACISIGAVREILSVGTIGGAYLSLPFTIPALETTFGGFLFVGIAAGIFRGVYNHHKMKLLAPDTDGEESLAEYAEDMGEFLTGRKSSDKPETIKIYHSAKKKKKPQENLFDMSFRDNSALVEEFAAIVAGGADISDGGQPGGDEPEEDDSDETGAAEEAEEKDGETV